jgi:excisionase family DNA binding protein
MTPEEVAERLAITPKTVRRFLREGRLKAMKVGRLWRVRESDLLAYMKGERI